MIADQTERPEQRYARIMAEFRRCTGSPEVFGAARFQHLASDLDALAIEFPSSSKIQAYAIEARRYAESAWARGRA